MAQAHRASAKALGLEVRSAHFFELAYLDAGRCAIVAEGTGYVLEQGDVCIIPPSQVHYEAPIPPSDASYDLYRLSFVPPREGFQLARYEGATQSIREVDGVALYLGDTALDLLEKATSELRTGQRHAYAAARGYLSVLAALVSRQVFEWREQGAKRREQWNDQVIREVVHFIGRNFHRPDLSVADMANHVAFSPSYFSVYFKDRTGCSPYRYLLEMRMQRARTLLASDAETVASIAEHVGFSSPYYFSSTFKRHYGVSPTEYRNSLHDSVDPST